jgi:hypothetical protein
MLYVEMSVYMQNEHLNERKHFTGESYKKIELRHL